MKAGTWVHSYMPSPWYICFLNDLINIIHIDEETDLMRLKVRQICLARYWQNRESGLLLCEGFMLCGGSCGSESPSPCGSSQGSVREKFAGDLEGGREVAAILMRAWGRRALLQLTCAIPDLQFHLVGVGQHLFQSFSRSQQRPSCGFLESWARSLMQCCGKEHQLLLQVIYRVEVGGHGNETRVWSCPSFPCFTFSSSSYCGLCWPVVTSGPRSDAEASNRLLHQLPQLCRV